MSGRVPGRRNRLAALDPTVHGRSLAFSAVHGPPSYDAEGSTGSGHPATSARHLCSATLVLTTPPLPSTKTPHLVDGLPSQALTVRVWALFPGRSVPFQGDLPCQRPVSRKVGAFSGGTFHARGLFPGRSVPFQGDLPCQRPVSRKVGAFSGGPSMPEACFPEGRCLFRGTFHARGLFPGRSAPFQGDLPCQRPVSRKVGAFSGGPSMPEACFPEGPDIILGDQPRRDRFFGRSWGCWQGRWCYPHVFWRALKNPSDRHVGHIKKVCQTIK